MRSILPLTILSGILLLSACTSPVKPVDQDGTELWLAAGRPVAEIRASVETGIDTTLAAEGFHIYDTGGIRHVDGGSEAGLRYGLYALQRAEVMGKDGPGMDLQENPSTTSASSTTGTTWTTA